MTALEQRVRSAPLWVLGVVPLLLIGLAIGLGVAAVVSRVLRSLLYGVAATDLATYAAVAAFLTAVAVAASYVPARRAARSDPVTETPCTRGSAITSAD